MKRQWEPQNPYPTTGNEVLSKELRIALMEDHRWNLTDLDHQVIKILEKESLSISSQNTNQNDHSCPSHSVIPIRSSSALSGNHEQVETIHDVPQTSESAANVEVNLSPPAQLGNQIIRLMIDYIIEPPRLFFCYEIITWREFHNGIQNEYSCDELRDMFIMRILPKIFTYNLPESTKKSFEILKFSSSFDRIPTGFLVDPLKKYVAGNLTLKRNVDYRVIDAADRHVLEEQSNDNAAEALPQQEFRLDTQNSNPAPPHIAVVVGDSNFYETGRSSQPKKVISKNLAILSAAVSYDYELFLSICHTPAVIRHRLDYFKQQYNVTGELPENLNPQRLKKKLEEFAGIRNHIVNMTNDRFSMNSVQANDNVIW